MAKWRAVCYINQFFGQYGGEEAAGMGIAVREEAVGPAIQLERAMAGQADVAATIICGDNYIGERLEEATEQILALIRGYRPDFVVAGPAFTAGRYGVACGSVCAAVERELHIPALTGMCPENPGAELYRDRVYIIRTSGTARSMRTEMEKIAALAQKLLTGAEVGTPEEEGYLFRGRAAATGGPSGRWTCSWPRWGERPSRPRRPCCASTWWRRRPPSGRWTAPRWR